MRKDGVKAVLGGDVGKLLGAFIWANTPEGQDYWQKIWEKKKLSAGARAKLLAMLKAASPPKGFAALSPERLRAIAAKGGKAVRPENRGFSKNPELARAAG